MGEDDPITVTYNSGTATVGIESQQLLKGAVIVSGGTGIDVTCKRNRYGVFRSSVL
jgi:hypothetical protein